jgi:hypothetical protein
MKRKSEELIMKRKSVVVILAYIMIVSLLIIAGAAISKAVNGMHLSRLDSLHTEARYIAEGGINEAAFLLANNIANHLAEPAVGAAYFTVTENNYLTSDFDVQYTCAPLENDRTVAGIGGTTSYERNYHLIATATHTTYNDVSATVNQIATRILTPTFQHAVFYADDLEMLPGPDMTLSGRVHSNSDIYIATNNTFTIDNEYLYSAGDIYNRRKDSATAMNGDVSIKIAGSASYALMEAIGDSDPLDSDRADWTNESQIRWNGTVQSTVHGVTTLTAPAVGSISPTGYYSQQADLNLTHNSGGGWTLLSGGSSVNVGDLPAGTIVEDSFYDNREDTTVTVTNIDMALLNASGYFPGNGLFYVTEENKSTSQPNGVRLINGDTLNGDLTVVSDGPVYVQGDYNTNAKQPAAIICDALNLLSNSWNDANSTAGVDSRVASATTVNAAFISGIVATVGSDYSGGLENYPRLHENWSGKTLYIRGSFVELWESLVARGEWQYGSPVYKAPGRNWDYDTDFNDPNNLPPFTPFAIETEAVAWWTN